MEDRDGIAKQSISRYLSARSAYWPSFSPDGQRLAFISDITGVPQTWQVRLVPGLKEVLWPDQLTFGADRVMGLWFAPIPNGSSAGDGWLLYAHDSGGSEQQQLTVVDTGAGTEIPLTAGYEAAVHHFGAWSRDGARILFAANRRDPGLFDLYVQPVDGGARLVWQNDEPGYLANMSFSPDGGRAVATRVSSSFRHALVEVELASGEARIISPTRADTRYEAVCYAPDGRSLLLNTDLESDFLSVVRLRLDDMITEPIVSLEWDAELMTLSPNGQYLAYAANVEGASELVLLDLATGKARSAPGVSATAGVVGMADGRLAFGPDSRYLAFAFTSATQASNVYVWDLEKDQVQAVTRSSQGGMPPDAFVSPELVHYPTFDHVATGMVREIPAWFFKPTESHRARAPAVIYVHGGPASQFRPHYLPLLQYLVRQGYAVLAPNVRGSTGYGKAYASLDDVEKRMDSVEDVAYAARWLKDQPGIDGEQIVIYGRSYGGFMVLSSVTTHPDLWAAAVDVVGISNWVTFLENTSGYRRAHREAEYGSLETDRPLLERISPIHHVDRINAPLMIIHGANDPRVPVSEAEQLAAALSQRGIPVEILIFDDEGHTLSRVKNKQIAYGAVVDFLNRHLK